MPQPALEESLAKPIYNHIVGDEDPYSVVVGVIALALELGLDDSVSGGMSDVEYGILTNLAMQLVLLDSAVRISVDLE